MENPCLVVPTPMGWHDGQFTKKVFCLEFHKCPELYWKVMFANLLPPLIQNLMFSCQFLFLLGMEWIIEACMEKSCLLTWTPHGVEMGRGANLQNYIECRFLVLLINDINNPHSKAELKIMIIYIIITIFISGLLCGLFTLRNYVCLELKEMSQSAQRSHDC